MAEPPPVTVAPAQRDVDEPVVVDEPQPVDEEAVTRVGHDVGHDGHGPPPPVVPQIRKGAKASLRRKGAR
jgi:hypothetical protein